jgi:ABC-2 type transport system permease protein
MVQFYAMLRKDLKMVYRTPTAFGLLLVMPFLLMAIVSEAFKPLFQGEESFDVPVVDLDRSEQSAALLAELDALGALNIKPLAWDKADFLESDAEELFEGSSREISVLVIPLGFGVALQSGGEAGLKLYSNPVQTGFSRIILSQISGRLVIDDLLRAFATVLQDRAGTSAEEAREAVDEGVAPTLDAPRLRLEQQFVSRREALPSNFEQTVPGFSIMFTFWLSIFVAASIHAEKREFHTWRRTLVAPMPRVLIIASRVTAYVILGLAQLSVLFGLGWLFFGVSLGGHIPALLLVFVAMALVTTSFGFLMASLVQDYATLNSIVNLAVLVMATLGGALVPVFFLPDWVRAISVVTPHYWAMDAVQSLIILGEGLADILTQLGVLLAFAAAFFGLGFWRFRFTE